MRDPIADKTRAAALIADLRASRSKLRDALVALPAPADRTVAQRRDAMILRTLLDQTQFTLITSGVAAAADLTASPD